MRRQVGLLRQTSSTAVGWSQQQLGFPELLVQLRRKNRHRIRQRFQARMMRFFMEFAAKS
jgi:hypothetical protein